MNQRETSKEAWLKWLGLPSDSLDAKIVAALAEAGAAGLMCWQIEERIGAKHQSVSGNLTHLVERRIVLPTGKFGKTRSSRPRRAMLWKLNNRPPAKEVTDSRNCNRRAQRSAAKPQQGNLL